MQIISVILPVKIETASSHKEENLIRPAILRLRKTSSLFPVEIIVVLADSRDGTHEIAKALADCVVESPKRGRAFQMHLGAQKARGDYLLFLHADSRLPDNWQEALANALKEKETAAAAFRLSFDSEKPFYKMLAGLANFRTRLTGIPHGDQALGVTRENYFSCGGFPDVPLMEEYIFIPRLRRAGRLRILKGPIVTSPRRYEERGPLKNALKNILLILLFYLRVSPQKLSRWY